MIRRFIAGALALVLLSTCAGEEPAYAQTASSLAVKDATGTTRTLCETADGSGNLTGCVPFGAATSAAQSTGNGTLASILSALGTPLQAGGNVNVLSFPSSLSHVDANGVLNVTLTNPSSGGGTASTVSVSNFPATQPISASALPLPSGAATASGVAAVVTALGAPLQAGGAVTATSSSAITNPTSTLTLPSTTTAYAAGQLVASSATTTSVAVPSFLIANASGGALIPRLRLVSNDPTSTGWGGVQVQIDLWSIAPTFSAGDRAAFAVATGSAAHLATFNGTFSAVGGDGSYAELAPVSGTVPTVKLATGQSAIFWTLQTVGATGTTAASKSMTLTAEVSN